MQFTKGKKVAAALGAGAMAVAGSGVAYAYWTTTGTGSGAGSATAGIDQTLTFKQAALNAMYPGDTAQALTVTVTNPSVADGANPGGQKVYVAQVKAYLTIDDAHAAACSASDFLLGTTVANLAAAPGEKAEAVALTWMAQELAANGTADATGLIQFNDKSGLNGNQDGCKGAGVTIHYDAS